MRKMCRSGGRLCACDEKQEGGEISSTWTTHAFLISIDSPLTNMPFPKGQLSNTPNLQHKRILGPINQSKSRVRCCCCCCCSSGSSARWNSKLLRSHSPAPRQNNEKLFSKKKKEKRQWLEVSKLQPRRNFTKEN